MRNFVKMVFVICFAMTIQESQATITYQSNKTSKSAKGSSIDDFLNTKIPSGNKSKATKPNNANSKAKKYPGYYDLMNNADKYPEYGSKSVENGKHSRYYLWENGVKGYLNTQEMVFPDGTIRKSNGKIYKADGTQVNEYGVVIKGAKKIKPVLDAEKEKKGESTDDFLNTKIP